MAEYTNAAVQTVAANRNVLFTETPVRCNKGAVIHREGSGIITLRGLCSQCRTRYKVSFGGNIAVATGGTAGAISIAISLNGEPLPSAQMTVTPAAVGDFANVYASVYVSVPKCCCYTISVTNTSTQAIDVNNANLIVEVA